MGTGRRQSSGENRQARAYRTKVVETTKANAEYLRVVAEYRQRPQLVIQKIYQDAIEYVLGNINEKIIIQPTSTQGTEIRVMLNRDPAIKPKSERKINISKFTKTRDEIMAHQHLHFKEDLAVEHTHGKQIRVSLAMVGTLAGGTLLISSTLRMIHLRHRQFPARISRHGGSDTARCSDFLARD